MEIFYWLLAEQVLRYRHTSIGSYLGLSEETANLELCEWFGVGLGTSPNEFTHQPVVVPDIDSDLRHRCDRGAGDRLTIGASLRQAR
jgi:hypothetical protein